VDCGNARILAEVQKRAPKVEGIFITHYHDDHTDHAQAAATALNAKVYASPELGGVLRHPRAYRLPAGTANPITSLELMPEGKRVRWHEFEFTYLYYPGQTLFHGGLLVKKDGGETLFFIGDTFTPSGIDEYCLQNRNLLDDDQGYLYCLRKLREITPAPWLINQHVEPMFRFTSAEIGRMEQTQRDRRKLLAALSPFPHPNFSVDEQWAWFEPYEVRAKPGERLRLSFRLTNHAASPTTFRVNGRAHSLTARESKLVPVELRVPRAAPALWIAAVPVEVGDLKFTDWAEAIVRVERQR
jgi:glyoxylase-like metal-dependent hydrolase (beta-lactamase superfamily II)